MKGQKINYVFIGSCINFWIEDLCVVVVFVKGRKKADYVNVMVVFGFKQVEVQVKVEGLYDIFIVVGFDFWEFGCLACLGMNEDKVFVGEYCVFIFNCNFEGWQGLGVCIILASLFMVVVMAIYGELVDVCELFNQNQI